MTRDGYEHMHPPRDAQAIDPTRGGWITKRPANTETRVILNFDPALCCSVGPGFTADREVLPPALAARGVTPYEWSDHMQRLERDVQSQHCSACCCVTSSLTVIGLPFVCYQEKKYQEAAKVWLSNFNKEVGVLCAEKTAARPPTFPTFPLLFA